VTWAEFVREIADLAAARAPTHFVMRVGEHTILERTGTFLAELDESDDGALVFYIETAKGRGGGFQITRDTWGEADWLPAQGPGRILQIRMSRGDPVFTLHKHAAPGEQVLASA
jgi:hypothetical protein